MASDAKARAKARAYFLAGDAICAQFARNPKWLLGEPEVRAEVESIMNALDQASRAMAESNTTSPASSQDIAVDEWGNPKEGK